MARITASAPPCSARYSKRGVTGGSTLVALQAGTNAATVATMANSAYDNFNFFVIGYSPTERPSIVSIAAGANGVGLCFIRGASLRDPKKILLGSGNQTRFLRLESPGVLAQPDVEALIAAAATQAKVPLRATGRGKLIIRSSSAKQRPRRKPGR
jgi:hypothetical protein